MSSVQAESVSAPAAVLPGCAGPGATAAEALWPAGEAPAARLIRLRWLAVAASVASAVLGGHAGILEDPRPILWVTLVLAVANAAWATNLIGRNFLRSVPFQLMVDLTALTLLLHYAGGVANPLVMLYLVHAILAAILLPRRQSYLVAGFACVAFKTIAVGQLFGWLPHHALQLGAGGTITASLATSGVYVAFLVAICVGLMATSVYFVSQVMEGLRARETALRSARSQLQAAINSIQDGIVLFDDNGIPVACNGAMRQDGCEYAGDAGLSTGNLPLAPGCQGCPRWPFGVPAVDALRAIRSTDCATPLTPEQETDGRRFRHRLFPVDRERAGVSLVWVREDVTQQRQLEAQARHQDRMAAVGLLAAGVAHEIRNPLASISAIVEDTCVTVADDEVREDLGMVSSQVHRISRILGELNGFARPPSTDRAPVDLNQVAREAIRIARFDPRSRDVEIATQLTEELPLVTANRDQLIQVSLNLVLNALEAMPQGGTLRVQSRCGDKGVEISFQDTGSGIPEEYLDRVLDPFYTTKNKGEGAGLGLSVCANIVRAHGGEIGIRSRQGVGSRFTVHLPAGLQTDQALPAVPLHAAARQAAGG